MSTKSDKWMKETGYGKEDYIAFLERSHSGREGGPVQCDKPDCGSDNDGECKTDAIGCGEPIHKVTEAAMPLIKYLNENHHPHTTVIVTPTGVEVLEGTLSNQNITEYLKD